MRTPLLLLLIASPVLAGEAAVENLPRGLAEVVAAERAFSKRCGEVGIRASFLEFFAPKSVSFAPDPGPARERLEKRPAPKEPPPVLLEWGPEQAEIAAAGDLGWTTGPFRLSDRTGKNPPRSGTYFSLWRKQADGSWKVELDLGVDSPQQPIPTVASAVGPRRKPAEGGEAAIRRVNEAFCKQAEKGAGKAYLTVLAPGGRVHRDGMAPLVGDKAWRPWASGLGGAMTCTTDAVLSSSGPGLGYAYGSWERKDKDVVEKGYYTRVWRHDGEWQIAVDVGALVK